MDSNMKKMMEEMKAMMYDLKSMMEEIGMKDEPKQEDTKGEPTEVPAETNEKPSAMGKAIKDNMKSKKKMKNMD